MYITCNQETAGPLSSQPQRPSHGGDTNASFALWVLVGFLALCWYLCWKESCWAPLPQPSLSSGSELPPSARRRGVLSVKFVSGGSHPTC